MTERLLLVSLFFFFFDGIYHIQICCERRRQMHCWWVSDITIPLIVLTVLLSDIIDNNHVTIPLIILTVLLSDIIHNNHVTIPLIILTLLLSDIIHHNHVGAGRSKWFLCQMYHALCFYLILRLNLLWSSIWWEYRKVYRSQENIIFSMKKSVLLTRKHDFFNERENVQRLMHNRRFCIFIS